MVEHLEEYTAWLADQGRSPRTVHQYRHKIRNLLTWLDGQTPTPALLHQYRLSRQSAGRRPRTIRVDFTAGFDFFRWLEKTGRASALPRAGCVKLPSLDDARRESPTAEEVLALVRAARGMPQHTDRKRYLRGRALGVVAVFAFAGLRRAELLALEVGDVWRDSEPWTVYVRQGKGAQSRQVQLGELGRELLGEWIAVRHRWSRMHGYTGDALFPVDRRRRLSNLGLDTIWDELLELAGIKRRVTPHGLRHWYGSWVQEHEDLATAQAMLGHKRIETTLGYLKTNDAKRTRAAESFQLEPVRTPETRAEARSQPGAPVPEPRRLTRRSATGRHGLKR